MREQLAVLQNGGAEICPAQLALKARLAVRDVLLAFFLLEPLLDLRARLIAVADVQPVAARTLCGLRGQNLNNIAVFELLVVACDTVVDLRADHRIADARMNCVGEVDRR